MVQSVDVLLSKSKSELVRIILEKEDIQIPVSIFVNNSPLESLVKYLKDNRSMSIKDISFRLNRSLTTIWTTYYNAKEINIKTDSKIRIPLSILAKNKHSTLECITQYLKHYKGMRLFEIAILLKRDPRTIWTCYNRFMIKEGKNEK